MRFIAIDLLVSVAPSAPSPSATSGRRPPSPSCSRWQRARGRYLTRPAALADLRPPLLTRPWCFATASRSWCGRAVEPGETVGEAARVPVDGHIVSGTGSLDEAPSPASRSRSTITGDRVGRHATAGLIQVHAEASAPTRRWPGSFTGRGGPGRQGPHPEVHGPVLPLVHSPASSSRRSCVVTRDIELAHAFGHRMPRSAGHLDPGCDRGRHRPQRTRRCPHQGWGVPGAHRQDLGGRAGQDRHPHPVAPRADRRGAARGVHPRRDARLGRPNRGRLGPPPRPADRGRRARRVAADGRAARVGGGRGRTRPHRRGGRTASPSATSH